MSNDDKQICSSVCVLHYFTEKESNYLHIKKEMSVLRFSLPDIFLLAFRSVLVFSLCSEDVLTRREGEIPQNFHK